MDKRDIDEANAIIDFQEQEMTWKDWALIVVLNIVAYVFLTGLHTIFGN